MKANELRIGNLVFADLYGEKPILVESICSINEDIFNSTTGEIPISSLKPIPLTEEWLLKFGFVNNFLTTKGILFEIGHVGSDFVNNEITLRINQVLSLKIHHVHQLQNLYFALTNQEL
jgi:hypothetical protein